MNDQHASALALIKEMHALEATEVTVGDVHVKFNRAQLVPMPLEIATKSDMEAELEALRIFKAQLEGQY